ERHERCRCTQGLTSEGPGESYRRELARLAIQIDFMGAEDKEVTMGNVHGAVDQRSKVGEEVVPKAQDMVGHPARRRDLRCQLYVDGIASRPRERVRDEVVAAGVTARHHHSGIETAGQRDAHRPVRLEIARQELNERSAEINREGLSSYRRLGLPHRRDEVLTLVASVIWSECPR